MQDKQIKCECGEEFTFTVGEQKFFQSRDFSAPKRCAGCRAEKKKKFDEADTSAVDDINEV